MHAHLPFHDVPRTTSIAPILAALALLVALSVVGFVAAWLGDSAPPPAAATETSKGVAIEGSLRLPPDARPRKRSVWM